MSDYVIGLITGALLCYAAFQVMELLDKYDHRLATLEHKAVGK